MSQREAHIKAVEKVKAELAKPDTEENFTHADDFNPWELFPSLYGTYCRSFDDCAIDVLKGLASRPMCWNRSDLAAQMFREMLCTADLCEYGTSPRVCFPTPEFKEVLGDLIARWEAYRERDWCKS